MIITGIKKDKKLKNVNIIDMNYFENENEIEINNFIIDLDKMDLYSNLKEVKE